MSLANIEIYNGEEASFDYYGPYDPSMVKIKSKRILKDKVYYDQYPEQIIDTTLFELARFYTDDLLINKSCPRESFLENADYLKYLFRLLTMSYLYESIKKSHYTLHSLGGQLDYCPKNIKKILSRCKPESKDMKIFLKRAKHFFERKENKQKYISMTGKARQRWISTFKYRVKSQMTASRIASWCEYHNCEKMNVQTAVKALTLSCKEDVKLVSLICNENDSLFGMKSISLAKDIIKISHSINVINRGGYARSCIDKFQNSFVNKETSYYQLENVFKIVHSHFKKNNFSYLEGELYLPGSLKEFDDLGLKNFIFNKKLVKTKKIKTIVSKKTIANVEALAMPKKRIFIAKKQKKKIQKRVFYKQKIDLKRSYFKKMYNQFKIHSGKTILNPVLYKKDYTFSSSFIKKMKGPLEIYKTRVAIEDMLKYDKIGSFENPFQISFIKYLIDYNQHHGLFNLTSILGNTFYIKNDLEKEKLPIYIELINDESSKFKWQISFIKTK